jgi:serine protease
MSDVADGVAWASGAPVTGTLPNPYPAKVINLSLAARGAPCSVEMQGAIDKARANGSVVVVAAGNANEDAVNISCLV